MKRHLCLAMALVLLLFCSCSASTFAPNAVYGSIVDLGSRPQADKADVNNSHDVGNAQLTSGESSAAQSESPGQSTTNSNAQNASGGSLSGNELRSVWISYPELKTAFASSKGFKATISGMFETAKNAGMNAVIVQVRPFNDAIYPSAIFPWSAIISGTQGVAPDYDPLAYMIKSAHELGLEFHAWLNPYRVALNSTDPYALSENNFARVWMLDSDSSNDDWAVVASNGIYLNPAIPQVQQKIIDGVKEIVQKYDVDGIHFDDYFYPTTDESFDSAAYAEYRTTVYGTPLALADWRRANVNAMISGVYSAAKQRGNVAFGVSPAADIQRNYNQYYADFAAWLNGGYIDYLMPQIYFGFEHPLESTRFDVLLGQWTKLMNGRNAALYVGLAPYKIGTTSSSDAAEWSSRDDILEREILLCRSTGAVDGYAFYSYTYLFSDGPLNKAQREKVINLFK